WFPICWHNGFARNGAGMSTAITDRTVSSVPLTATAPRTLPAPSGERPLGCWDLFVIFFKSGCAFGGGAGILAALDRELVDRRGAVSREDLLATYTLGRVVPSGTMTAVAIAYGHRFAGFPGTLAALAGLLLPGVSLTLLLIIGYAALGDSPVL